MAIEQIKNKQSKPPPRRQMRRDSHLAKFPSRVIPPLVLTAVGLSICQFLVKQKQDDKDQKPNSLLELGAKCLQPIFLLMAMNSVMAGINLCSPLRVISYLGMCVLTVFAALFYNKLINAQDKLIDLNQSKTAAGDNSNDINSNDSVYLAQKHKIQHLASLNTLLSKLFFPLALALTFVAGLTQRTAEPHLKNLSTDPKLKGFGARFADFKDKAPKNLERSKKAFRYYSGSLFSAKSWKETIGNFTGANQASTEKYLKEQGKTKLNWLDRLSGAWGEPLLNCQLVLINMFTRVASALIYAYLIKNYGTEVLNLGTAYEDPELASKLKSDKLASFLRKLAQILSAIGIGLVCSSSISSGLSPTFARQNTKLGAVCEITGGSLYGTTLFTGFLHIGMLDLVLKMLGSGFLQATNAVSSLSGSNNIKSFKRNYTNHQGARSLTQERQEMIKTHV